MESRALAVEVDDLSTFGRQQSRHSGRWMRRSTRVTTQAVLDEVVAQDLSPDVFADGHRALRSVPCAGAHSPTNRRASPVNTHVVADRAGAEVAVHRGCRFGGHRRARLALESSLAGEFSTAWGASGTLMRHFLSASPFAAPVPVAALALGVTVPAASRALIPASRRAQALTPGEVAAIGPAVLLAPVAARADEHLASASGTQKQSGIVHRPPPAGRAGRSAITGQYCARSRTQVRIWAQPRT